ncbi:MAG: urease subunit beta [Actinobacteria bacterium]|nr:urease subunit beta [Actinomycetota bacterium]MCB9390216.1 urease subunit beta [Acidimicrobiia bacterium]
MQTAQGSGRVRPGETIVGDEPVELFAGRDVIEVLVANTGDRPIQVGSHFHFFETNAALDFDRQAARGFRLAIPAGTSVRFEPGIERTVSLVAFGGDRIIRGLRGMVAGPLDADPSDSAGQGDDSRGDS